VPGRSYRNCESIWSDDVTDVPLFPYVHPTAPIISGAPQRMLPQRKPGPAHGKTVDLAGVGDEVPDVEHRGDADQGIVRGIGQTAAQHNVGHAAFQRGFGCDDELGMAEQIEPGLAGQRPVAVAPGDLREPCPRKFQLSSEGGGALPIRPP